MTNTNIKENSVMKVFYPDWFRGFVASSPVGAASFLLLLMMVLIAILADVVSPSDPLQTNYKMLRHGPTLDHPMGYDFLGRDVLARIIYGGRTTLFVAFASVFIGKLIGFSWGISSAYFGGKFDLITQRFVEVLLAFPSIIFALMLLVALGSGVSTVILAISVGGMAGSTRVLRSAALTVKQNAYVEAARAMGASELRIIVRHVAPQCFAPAMVVASVSLGGAIFAESALSYLGLGVPPPNPSWGNMLNEASVEFLNPLWWMVAFPGAVITLTILLFNLLGDALRDHLDPRLRGEL